MSAAKIVLVFILISALYKGIYCTSAYKPTWESLDTRPLPSWYDKAKIGIFIHWGVFSVPSFHSEWFWAYWKNNHTDCVQFMENNYRKGFTYQDFAKDFTAEFFDPNEWATIFRNSGANYVILTSKHHEGYTLWPSKYSFSWNAKDVGPHRDIIDELSKAVRKKGMYFGLYHSLYEWFNPLYLSDNSSNFTSSRFVLQKVIPEMVELVENYKPDVLWSDGDWEAPDTYWRATKFLAWLYNKSPVKDNIVVNDRWGKDIPCKHGDFFTCSDRFNPGVLQSHKWENAMTLDKKSWGFRRNANLSDYLTIHELITTLVQTISCGGNLCINVGPTKDGTIAPIFQDRLSDLGKWLAINGEAVYESQPWTAQNDTLSGAWYTSKPNAIYAFILCWPHNSTVNLVAVSDHFQSNDVRVELLGHADKLSWVKAGPLVSIQMPNKANVVGDWAWVLKITNYTKRF